MGTRLEFFDIYTSKLNWQITPVWADTKSPVLKGWNKDYDKNKIREYFEDNPDFNLGLCLGHLIDVEADSEKIGVPWKYLIGDYPHPMWQSSRSVHHLFINPDPKLTKITIQNIEFRAHLHQSLLPPSEVNGVKYKWIRSDFPVPPMPKSLLKFYWKNINNYIRPKLGMKVRCIICRDKFYKHSKRTHLEIEAFKSLGKFWECPKCRNEDIRYICSKLKKEH